MSGSGDAAYPYLFAAPEPTLPTHLGKRTLVASPQFVAIFPNFRCSMHKRFQGLTSATYNDEEYQSLVMPESESQDWFDDDVDEFLSGPLQMKAPEVENQVIEVIVRATSLVVDGIEYLLASSVASACVVSGTEDTLVLALQSGSIITVRMFYVPYDYESSKTASPQLEKETEDRQYAVFKPFVGQWWQCQRIPTVKSIPGWVAIKQGSAAANGSDHGGGPDTFRIHPVTDSANGALLMPHTNIDSEGVVLDWSVTTVGTAADITPSLVALMLTNHNRMVLAAYTWQYAEDSSSSTGRSPTLNISKTLLPLPPSYSVPVFVIPVTLKASDTCPTPGPDKNSTLLSGDYLSVSPTEVSIVSISDILSGNTEFRCKAKAPWHNQAFPTCFYVSNEGSIYIATSLGVVFRCDQSCNAGSAPFLFRPVLNVGDSISTFTLEPIDGTDKHQFIYGSDTDGNKDLEVELFGTEDVSDVALAELPRSPEVRLRKGYGNWTPILDVAITPAYAPRSGFLSSSHEVWTLCGTDKRTRLTQLRRGSTIDVVTCDPRFRKTLKAWPVQLELSFLVCSSSFETTIYQLSSESDALTVEESFDEPTIYAGAIADQLIRVTPSRIFLGESEISECFAMCTSFFGAGKWWIVGVDINDNVKWYQQDLSLLGTYQLHHPASTIEGTTEGVFIGTFNGAIIAYSAPDVASVIDLRQWSPYSELRDPGTNLIIPHDIHIRDKQLYIGTKDGYFIGLDMSSDLCLNKPKCSFFYRVASTPVSICSTGPHLLLSCQVLWRYDTNCSPGQSLERVYFPNEKHERSVYFCANLGSQVAIFRDDGLAIGDYNPWTSTVLRQVIVGDRAIKMVHVPHLQLFVVLCRSTSPGNRLKVVDRKQLRPVRSVEMRKRPGGPVPLFDRGEIPLCAQVWSINRGERISRKLLVGCSNGSGGSFKVVDVIKQPARTQESASPPPGVIIEELTSFSHPEPILHIRQVGEVIVFVSGCHMYQTCYDSDRRRLNPATILKQLPSRITSVEVHTSQSLEPEGLSCNDQQDDLTSKSLLVTTERDSVFQFSYTEINGQGLRLEVLSKARRPHCFINQAPLGPEVIVAGDKYHGTLTFFHVGDQSEPERHIQTSGIPRVYPFNDTPSWHHPQTPYQPSILSVGIAGDVDQYSLLFDQKILNDAQQRRFANKVSGTGLFDLRRANFDWKCNRGQYSDLDV
ncbi:hypothetical protein DICA0_D23464 [Diutina catenulata]